MIKKILLLLLIFHLSMVVFGCSRENRAIQLKGSDTMVNLGQAWAEDFMKANPTVSIAITGGGSGTGIAALISGTTDITLSSREMQKKEIKMAEERGIEPNEIHVASDGIAVVVNPKNTISKLSIKQLSDIYTGKIKNWKDVNGLPKKIVALSRERNSGTHVFFLEYVVKLGKKKNKNEFDPAVLMMPSSHAIVEEVMANTSAIGYIGLGYLNEKLKALAIAKDENGLFVAPNIETVKTNKYPISRSLLFYTNGKPNSKIKPFIDFVLSKKGQDVVLKMDFVPIK